MTALVLPVLIVAIVGDAPRQGHLPEATQVFHCDFGRATDADYDDWPDGWTRRCGQRLPHYVAVKITPDASAPGGGHCLCADLDGGGAVAVTPAIAVRPGYEWVLDAFIKTDGLEHDQAFLSLTFLDDKRRPVDRRVSEAVGQTTPWKKIRLGPFSPTNDQVRWAVIAVHLEPPAGEPQEDLKGSAQFADIWLGQLPRIMLSTGRPVNIVADGDPIQVACRVTRLTANDPRVTFALFDVQGERLAQQEVSLLAEASADRIPGKAPGDQAPGCAATWQPPLAGPGFYRVEAAIRQPWGAVCRRTLSVAVIEPLPRGAPREAGSGGPFGWSLPPSDKPLPPAKLLPWLSQAGVHWVKYPLWHDWPAGDRSWDDLSLLLDRLEHRGIFTVGVLDAPPPGPAGRPALQAAPGGRRVLGRSCDLVGHAGADVGAGWPAGPLLATGPRRRHELRRLRPAPSDWPKCKPSSARPVSPRASALAGAGSARRRASARGGRPGGSSRSRPPRP